MPRIASLLPPREERIFGRSQWIWPYDHRWDLHNAYALFRRDFTLEAPPRRAPLFITADQSFHLYINGAFVGRGPARGFQSHWPYDEIDVARWLVPGRNVIAVRAHNPGQSNFQYISEGYAGLLVAADWGGVRIHSDREWKCTAQPGLRRDTIQGSLQLFPQEHYDVRAGLVGWMNSDFDDDAWSAPKAQKCGVLPWAGLEPREIPHLFEEALRPGRVIGESEGASGPDYATSRNLYVLRQNEDHTHAPVSLDATQLNVPATGTGRFRSYLIDVGRPVVGSFSIEVGGARGGELIDFVYTEVINAAKLEPALRFPDGSSVTFSNRLTCRSGRNEHMFYHVVGFRYVMVVVRDSTTPLQVGLCLRRSGYPVVRSGSFRSSEIVLEQIWETCAWSQQNCMLDAYVDTPWREQAQWWGDARVQAWNTFHLCGDARLFRRGIYQIGGQTTADGLTYGHAPTMGHNCVIPDFTLIWMITQWDYFWQTGDLQPFRDQRAVIDGALRYFEEHTGTDGLVHYDPRYWLFLDWTDLPRDGASSIYNLWLVLALERLAEMHRLTRDHSAATRCTNWAKRLRGKLRGFVNARGLMTDGLDAKGRPLRSTSPHAQAMALMANLAPKSGAVMEKFLLEYLRDEKPHRAKASAYWVTYIYSLLTERGHGAEVIAHLRPHWQPMIAQGSTFELYEDHPEFPISHSHAWSAHPLFHLMAIVGGIRQAAPAWKKIIFAPEFIGDSGGATVPTPAGAVSSSWRREGNMIHAELSLPRGVSASVSLPGQPVQNVTGKRTWSFSR